MQSSRCKTSTNFDIMEKLSFILVAALLVSCVIINVTAYTEFLDEYGNPCPPCAYTLPGVLTPACGSNGVTYESSDFLRCHSICLQEEIQLEHYGPCTDEDFSFKDEYGNVCSLDTCAATADMNPVCGSNGRTYPNKSILQCHNKCRESKIRVLHEGPCTWDYSWRN